MEENMQMLKDYITRHGVVKDGRILKVDSFLNHQIDPTLMDEIGKVFHEAFGDKGVTKVLTIEASGIAIGLATARYFGVPLVFAKKVESLNLDGEMYQSQVFSYTKDRTYPIRVAKKFLSSEDRVLIVDDFLADGNAALGLLDICAQAGASVDGFGVVIEKGFQQGGAMLREKGVPLLSLAIIEEMAPGMVRFR